MPPQEEAYRTDKALLWPTIGLDRFSKAIRGPAEVLDVRVEVERKKPGEELVVEKWVHVAQEIPLQSLMWIGDVEDWYSSGSVGGDDEVMIVTKYNEAKDIKGREVRRWVQLTRFQGRPPYPPFVGTSASVDLEIMGANFADGDCPDCEEFNANFLVPLTINNVLYQEWQLDIEDIYTGTGTGTWDDSTWRWMVQRYLDQNVVVASLYRLTRGAPSESETVLAARWRLSGVEWNGVTPISFMLETETELCEFPNLLTVRGL